MVTVDTHKLAEGSSFYADGQLQSVTVNPRYGSGYLSQVRSLTSGISVVIQNFSLHGEGAFRLPRDQESCPPVIAFFTCYSGVGQISYDRPRIPLGNGFSNINFPEYTAALSMDVKGNTPIQTLIVCMELAVFAELTGKTADELIEALEMLNFHAGERQKKDWSRSIDFAQRMCGYQALDSFINHPRDTLFLEAKALELAALHIRQLEHLTGKTDQREAASQHVEKIAQACLILKEKMAAPPGARELARKVGLNHNQLVRGFREMFGLGPFEYLRAIRLEKARELIAGHECNVTEAAFNVGYSSLSHFSKAFRDEFGINPKACA